MSMQDKLRYKRPTSPETLDKPAASSTRFDIMTSLQPPSGLRTVLQATLLKLEHRLAADANPDLVKLKQTLLRRIAALDDAELAKQS